MALKLIVQLGADGLAALEDPGSPHKEISEEDDEDDEICLPPGGRFTVMMFGMTGAGKSALGNLLAGFEAFASGDDTASVTNLDSVMRYEAGGGGATQTQAPGLRPLLWNQSNYLKGHLYLVGGL